MKLKSTLNVLYILALFFCINSTFANPGEGDPTTDPGGAPLNPADQAPIDDYLVPMLIMGTITAFVLLRKKKVQNA
jgi:hypothetical protein